MVIDQKYYSIPFEETPISESEMVELNDMMVNHGGWKVLMKLKKKKGEKHLKILIDLEEKDEVRQLEAKIRVNAILDDLRFESKIMEYLENNQSETRETIGEDLFGKNTILSEII